MFGKNAEAMGEDCLMCGLASLINPVGYGAAIVLRGRLREKRGIDGSLTSDLLWGCLCPFCTLIQEAAEIRVMQGGAMAGDIERC